MDKNRGILLLVVAFFSAVSVYDMTSSIMRIPVFLNNFIGGNRGGEYGLVINATIGETVFS